MDNGKRNTLWTEHFRPKDLDTYIGNEHITSKVKIFIQNEDIPHLLFHGIQGTGKTTLAKIIVNHIDCDYMYVNASDENSVEVVRTKVKNFASTIGFKPMKVVILDECLDENTIVVILRDGVEEKVKISDVDEHNDLVKSFNVTTNKIEWQPFYLWDKGEQEVYELELDNGEIIKCTEDHKWYVEDASGNTIVVKTKDLEKYNYILSPI